MFWDLGFMFWGLGCRGILNLAWSSLDPFGLRACRLRAGNPNPKH